MPPGLYLDLTHLSARLWTDAPAGIDRIDRIFAELITRPDGGFVGGIHQGPRGARAVSPLRAEALVRRIDARWRETIDAAADPNFTATRAWLTASARSGGRGATRLGGPRKQMQRAFRLHTLYRHSFASGPVAFRGAAPGSIYFNAAQWSLGDPARYAWLDRLPHVKPVFFVHDTLPLDVPEYFPPEVPAQHLHNAETLARHARGLVAASKDVAERITTRIAAFTDNIPPVLVAAPPAFETPHPAPAFDAALAARPYFVVVGTIEPRKNHLLLLNLWREMATGEPEPPRLLVIGARGWGNAQILDMLERSPALAGHVAEVNGLSSAGLRSLVAHSAGLLFPSFAEGFGLPVAEAVTLGAPAVASDIPVLHQTAGPAARYAGPLDGPQWRHAIEELTAAHTPDSIPHRIAEAAARPPRHEAFFREVLDFFAGL